jgi:hypothetical protein
VAPGQNQQWLCQGSLATHMRQPVEEKVALLERQAPVESGIVAMKPPSAATAARRTTPLPNCVSGLSRRRNCRIYNRDPVVPRPSPRIENDDRARPKPSAVRSGALKTSGAMPWTPKGRRRDITREHDPLKSAVRFVARADLKSNLHRSRDDVMHSAADYAPPSRRETVNVIVNGGPLDTSSAYW